MKQMKIISQSYFHNSKNFNLNLKIIYKSKVNFYIKKVSIFSKFKNTEKGHQIKREKSS